MVGDSWIDRETARRAGTAICLARYGFGYRPAEVGTLHGDEGLVDDPAEIPAVIQRLLDIS
jgi:phosphoglycolate phosphatase-like HAD superfamily hydrolase